MALWLYLKRDDNDDINVVLHTNDNCELLATYRINLSPQIVYMHEMSQRNAANGEKWNNVATIKTQEPLVLIFEIFVEFLSSFCRVWVQFLSSLDPIFVEFLF